MPSRLFASVFLLALASAGQAAAGEGRSFIVPANDGYGLAECLAAGAACGRLVADAWCEAQGLGKAISFGPAEATDVTGTVVAAATTVAPSYTITCHE